MITFPVTRPAVRWGTAQEYGCHKYIVFFSGKGDRFRKNFFQIFCRARKIVEDAEERAREIIGSSESALKTMSANYEALSLKHNELKDNMRRYLQNQLQSLDSDDIIIEPLGSLVSKDVSTMVKHVVNEVKNDDDNEETKINAKLKELMDAKIYDKGDQNDYRY